MLSKNLFKNKKGLSIIEVMIAFLIVGGVLFAIIQIFPIGLRSSTIAHHNTVAVFLAQAKMEEIVKQLYDDIPTGTVSENSLADIHDDFAGYSRTTVISYTDDNLNPSITDLGQKKIEITLAWNTFGMEKSLTINSLILE